MTRYQVKFQSLEVGDTTLEVRSLLDDQQFHDPDGEAELAGITSATWPLFGLVWPSARILAAAMLRFPVAGRRILEVGSGLGLASLVLHARRADITASDCHPLARAFLAENTVLNGMPPLPYCTGHWGRPNPHLGRFDLLIGSDLLYDRDLPDLLAGFVEAHTTAASEVIIVDPDRGNRPRFNRKMAELGYRCVETRAAAFQQSGEPYKGRFLHFTRPLSAVQS